jgi:signal transduction histidine kinase/ligand-binding sensor domain-containing protein
VIRGGLNRFNRKTGNFTRYLHNPKDTRSLINNSIGAIFEDSRGVFWVSTAGDGLHTMDRKKGTFERLPFDPDHPKKLSGPPPQNEVGLDLNNFFVTEDRSGAIWIASSKRWVTRYDPKTQKIHHFDCFNGYDHATQSVTEAFSSREGALWFTTWENSIYQVDPFEVRIPHFTTGSMINALHEDVSGALWLGTCGKGLIEASREIGSVKKIFTALHRPYGLPDSCITVIYEGDDTTLWIGSKEGLYHYNKKTKIFTRYVNDPENKTSLTKGIVNAIEADSPGSLWIATSEGLDRLNIKSGVFTHYRNNPNDSTSLGGNTISFLLKDHSGNLWTGGGGMLNLFNSRTGKFKHFACSAGIHSIIEDSENIIWVGTTNGLYRSNSVLDTFLLFTDPEIGLTATTIVAGILEDDKKNLWISSSAGILRLSSDRNEITVYSKNQGVDASRLTMPWGHNIKGVKGKRGKLFFGDRTGYYAFFPDQLKRNVMPPQIVFTDFRLADNQPIKPGKESPLNLPITYTKEIHLKYDQNVFSFDFIGIHYSSRPENIRMLFMMENLENTWRKASPEKKAFYYNVPPGNYIFRVKAANRDGVWAEKTITVIVNPPWWHTWWAYTLFIIVFFTMFWSFINWRQKVLKKEKSFLEQRVMVRTQELQAEKEKVESTLFVLKKTQSQLLESEKLTSLSEFQQAMLNERLRISRELHDDIGSTLSGIVLYSHLAMTQVQSQNIKEVEKSLSTIQHSANEMVSKLSDIVWAVNPEHNTLKNLMQKLEEYAVEIAVAKGMKVIMNLPGHLAEMSLPAENCHNIYLLGKEAINNAVKYSNASFIKLKANGIDHIIELSFSVNGKGFSVETTKKGNGLSNMRKRADDIGAVFSLQTCLGEGTEIFLQCKIT